MSNPEQSNALTAVHAPEPAPAEQPKTALQRVQECEMVYNGEKYIIPASELARYKVEEI